MRINIAYIFRDLIKYAVKSWIMAVSLSICFKNGWVLPFIANEEITYHRFLTIFFIFTIISVFIIFIKIKIGGYGYLVHKLLGSEKQ